jgi:two-component system OmpR family response regulator
MAAGHRLPILAVDDDPLVRRLIDRSLRSEGYDTRTCVSAESALVALRQSSYSLVLLDVVMGEVDGFELARRLRAGEAGALNRDTPVVFVTGETHVEAWERSFEVGAHAYLTKPFESDALVDVVAKLLHAA